MEDARGDDDDSQPEPDGDADLDDDGEGDEREPCSGTNELPIGERVEGDLARECSTTDPACSTSDGRPDVTYEIAHGAGLLTVELDSSFDAILELRSGVDEPSPDRCTDLAFADGTEIVATCVIPGVTWALVDGRGDRAQPEEVGAYAITASFESCDDGEICRPDLGACTAELDPGDACDAAVRLDAGATVLSRLESFGVFSVELPAEGELSFEVWDPAFRELPSAALRGDCNDADSEVAHGEYGSGGTCLSAGDYALAIEGDGELVVQTRFEACAEGEWCQRGACLPPLDDEPEPNDDPQAAPEVAPGASVAASLDPSTEVDWYRVRVPDGATLTASTLAGCDADTVVMIFDGLATIWPPAEETDCGEADARWFRLECSDDVERTTCGRAEVAFEPAGDHDVLVRVSRHSLERDDPEPGQYVLQLGIE